METTSALHAPEATFPGRQVSVAVGGLGAIGGVVARALDKGIFGLRLAAISARNKARAEMTVREFDHPVPVLALEELGHAADVVVECAPANLLPILAEPALRAGRKLVVVSAAALLSSDWLIEVAAVSGGQIIVPTGALLGLDAVVAAAEGKITSVRMVTRKPIAGLLGAPYIRDNAIDLTNIRNPLRVFSGSARDGAKGFPENVNVAAALSLAGIGADKTILEIWADPGVAMNIHEIEVVSDSSNFSMRIENRPSENPKTGTITALSVIALLRKMHSPLRIGT